MQEQVQLPSHLDPDKKGKETYKIRANHNKIIKIKVAWCLTKLVRTANNC